MPYLLNAHPTVFPQSNEFRPERWIEAKTRGEHLEKYPTIFTKGSRACLGIREVRSSEKVDGGIGLLMCSASLAYAELYLTVAVLVRNFDMELVGSTIEDAKPYRNFGLAFSRDYGFVVDFRVTGVL